MGKNPNTILLALLGRCFSDYVYSSSFPVVRKSCTRAIFGESEQNHRLVGFISRRAILRILSRLENIEEDIEQVSKLRRHG